MIGPEWVAQQKKLVSSRIANWGDRTASPTDISACGPPLCGGAALPAASASDRAAWLATATLPASTADPVTTTGRAPHRSDSVPQAMLQHAIARKPIVIALDTPATDQPVSRTIGCSSTGSENIAPIATQ